MHTKAIRSFLLLTVCVAAWGLTQDVSAQLFDQKKAQREIKIMSGILETTLEFATEETDHPWRSPSLRGYYLYDQGATFLVSVPSPRFELGKLSFGRGGGLSSAYALELEATFRRGAEEQLRREERDRAREAADRAREAADRYREAAKLADKAKDKMKERQEAMRGKLEEYQRTLDSARDALVEAVGDHGDSLTLVKDDEYINLVLIYRSDPWKGIGGLVPDKTMTDGVEVVSIKKSWVKAYKSGRLSLNEFKDKVLEY